MHGERTGCCTACHSEYLQSKRCLWGAHTSAQPEKHNERNVYSQKVMSDHHPPVIGVLRLAHESMPSPNATPHATGKPHALTSQDLRRSSRHAPLRNLQPHHSDINNHNNRDIRHHGCATLDTFARCAEFEHCEYISSTERS